MYGDQATPPRPAPGGAAHERTGRREPSGRPRPGRAPVERHGVPGGRGRGQRWFQKALAGFQQAASTEKKSAYFQYRVGKMYAMGYGVEQDYLEPPSGTSGPPGTTTILLPPMTWDASISGGRGWGGMRNMPWNCSSQRRSTKNSPTPTPCTSWVGCIALASAQKPTRWKRTIGTRWPMTLLCPSRKPVRMTSSNTGWGIWPSTGSGQNPARK